ncbi:MAG TPA: penicillin-binding transpeptidase domain-containing protein [Planctomycetota bacterium]|nr:penicillin-binding transpeptidase domain-containing protein [Planctomycetota bacterium]
MFKSRIGILTVLLGLGFLVVLGRLCQLQIWRYHQYAALARRDRETERMVPALRGPIYDRYGTLLAEDQPCYDISVRVDRLKLAHVKVDEIRKLAAKYRPPRVRTENHDAKVQKLRLDRDAEFELLVARLNDEPYVHDLARTLKADPQEIANNLRKALYAVACDRAAPRAPLLLASEVDQRVWLSLRTVHEDVFRDHHQLYGSLASKIKDAEEPPFPGLVATLSTRRIYPLGSTASFVVGALGELTPEDEEDLRHDGVLLDNAAARNRYWKRICENMSEETAEKVRQILLTDPRDVRDLGELYRLFSRLRPEECTAIAALGLAEPLRWSERPPRMKLTEPELLWMGVGLPTNVNKNKLPNRVVGELGVERIHNDHLRGKAGMKIRESATSEGEETLAFFKHSDPIEGEPLALTLSLAWQKAAENALKGQTQPGAIVVLDIRSGEVLALASWPDFDPNLFAPPRTGKERQEKLQQVLSNPNKPLLNRAIAEQYPLGSVMKSLVAAIALEKGAVTASETFDCAGFIVEGGQKFRCDESRAHGTVNIFKSIRCSCNVTFHQIGARMGVEGMAPYARLLLGRRTGIDLPGEVPGIYPDRSWRMKAWPTNPHARVWTRGNDFQLAIGQGLMTSTVLQAAVMMAAIGNGGYVVTPRVWLDSPPAQPRSLGISDTNLSLVRQGLDEVVNEGRPGERGTAYKPFHEHGELSIRVAGKTSTAEHRQGAQPHAWFAGYAPAEKPQIAFAILLEEAGHGGAAAAPLAYRMLRDVYGTKNTPNPRPGAPREPVAANGAE